MLILKSKEIYVFSIENTFAKITCTILLNTHLSDKIHIISFRIYIIFIIQKSLHESGIYILMD
jgi:hypothetical protein